MLDQKASLIPSFSPVFQRCARKTLKKYQNRVETRQGDSIVETFVIPSFPETLKLSQANVMWFSEIF